MGIIHLLGICLLVVEGWILSILCLVWICWLNLTYLVLLLRVDSERRKRTANGRQDGGGENVIGDSDISVAGGGRRGMCV